MAHSAFRRWFDRFFETLGARPIGILVFCASALAWVQLQASQPAFSAQAVAQSAFVEHPSRAASYVVEVFAAPGESVRSGTPLVRLSPHFLNQRLARLESQIEEVKNEAKLAQAQLLVSEQRWVAPNARLRPNSPSLANPTSALYEKQVEVLEIRKQATIDDRDSLLIVSAIDGLVAEIARVGSAVEEGGSVATVTPAFAEEMVAYVPPGTPPGAIASGTSARILEPLDPSCRAPAQVLRRGAAVMPTPEQLLGLLRMPQQGLPIHIALPQDCQLGIGQVVTVAFLGATKG